MIHSAQGASGGAADIGVRGRQSLQSQGSVSSLSPAAQSPHFMSMANEQQWEEMASAIDKPPDEEVVFTHSQCVRGYCRKSAGLRVRE